MVRTLFWLCFLRDSDGHDDPRSTAQDVPFALEHEGVSHPWLLLRAQVFSLAGLAELAQLGPVGLG